MLRGWLPALLVAGAAWGLCGPLINPYVEREKVDREAIVGLRGQIESANTALVELKTLEANASAARSRIDRFEQEISGPSALVSLPDDVKRHFARFGLNASIVRMNTVREESDLPGYSRAYWAVTLPIAEAGHTAAGSLLAVAEFEQQLPFVRILNFAIHPDPEAPARRIAQFNLAALIRK
jgi:hypothetical protein